MCVAVFCIMYLFLLSSKASLFFDSKPEPGFAVLLQPVPETRELVIIPLADIAESGRADVSIVLPGIRSNLTELSLGAPIKFAVVVVAIAPTVTESWRKRARVCQFGVVVVCWWVFHYGRRSFAADRAARHPIFIPPWRGHRCAVVASVADEEETVRTAQICGVCVFPVGKKMGVVAGAGVANKEQQKLK